MPVRSFVRWFALAGVVSCSPAQEPPASSAGTGAPHGEAGRGDDVATHAGSGGSEQAGSPAAADGGKGGGRAARAGPSGGSAAAAGSVATSAAGDLFVAPDGKDSAAGTIDAPTTLQAALPRIAAGHTLFVRGGTYMLSAQITIARDNSGSDGQLKQLFAYADEKPVLDFSAEPYEKADNPRGLQIDGSYWHVKGLTVYKSADNGIYVAGNNNIIENCVTHGNRDTGLQLGRYASNATSQDDWPSNNLILNCESYDNFDEPPGAGENADGFAAKLTVGTGNVFRGCVSHHNIDDGWDLYTKDDTGPIGGVTIDRCIAHHNGTLTDGTSNANGDRNGFKLGGEDIAVAHVVTRSVAFANGKNGFTWNSNPGAIRLSNTLAFDNADGNYRFGDNSTKTQAVLTNNVSFWTQSTDTQSEKTNADDAGQSNCFWSSSGTPSSKSAGGLMVVAGDFALPLMAAMVQRGADGSPDFGPFALAPGSHLIDAGVVPAGELPFPSSYFRGAPDLGAVETSE